MPKTIEFERRVNEKTVVQLQDGSEFTLTVTKLSATACKLSLEPGELVKRVLKEEPANTEAVE